MTKRELMIRGLVERSAKADLAATKLLFEMLRKADPRAIGPDPSDNAPLGEDALNLLKERIARLARAQLAALPPSTAADAIDLPHDAGTAPSAADPGDVPDPAAAGDRPPNLPDTG
jgi:hypothetical protein